MPKFSVQVQAHLHGVKSVAVPSENAADYPWHISLRCGSCGEATERPVVVSRSDQAEGIRGATVSLKISCKLCRRVNDLTVLPSESVYTSEDSPNWKDFLTLEARGVEPLDVELADNFDLSITGENGFQAEEAQIVDGEFYGYDENLGKEMTVTDWKMRVSRSK